MSENNISVERDFVGTLHIKVGDFDYVQIQYQHPFTDNASTRALADRIVAFLAQPAEAEGDRIASGFVILDGMAFSKDEILAQRVDLCNALESLSAVTAERDSLDAECGRLLEGKIQDAETIYILEAERDQLRAEVEALRKDAERYQWITENCDIDYRGHRPDGDYASSDEAIDTAMAAKEA